MTFWLIAAALVAATLFVLVRSLMSAPAAQDVAGGDVAHFRAQEAEIDRQLASGVIDEAEARATKAEAARRLLALARTATPAARSDSRRGRAALALTIASVPVAAVALYLKFGSPGLPAQPYASRADLNRADQDLARVVARLDAHLADSPDDARAYELAFPVYMRLGRYDAAATAAERLVVLQGPTAQRYASLAEATIFAQGGMVTDAARTAIEQALALDPALSRARFYAGLAAEQAGDPAKALEIWRALDQSLGEGAEKRAVAAQIVRLSASTPPSEAEQALRNLPAGEQRQAIRSMVDGLESRLTRSGGAAAEWARLVRALAVLGERERATAALNGAEAAHGADPAARAALAEVATEFGLKTGAAP